MWADSVIGKDKTLWSLWILLGLTPFIGMFIHIIYLCRLVKAYSIYIESILNEDVMVI
jgi:hypothetical protein